MLGHSGLVPHALPPALPIRPPELHGVPLPHTPLPFAAIPGIGSRSHPHTHTYNSHTVPREREIKPCSRREHTIARGSMTVVAHRHRGPHPERHKERACRPPARATRERLSHRASLACRTQHTLTHEGAPPVATRPAPRLHLRSTSGRPIHPTPRRRCAPLLRVHRGVHLQPTSGRGAFSRRMRNPRSVEPISQIRVRE